MPVIRVDETTTTTTVDPQQRASLLTKLKDEFKKSTEQGPVIFEIPLGTECFDVLVVWEEWADWPSDERSRLILDAYEDDRRNQIAQASGVTYHEAIQQQLLPYTIVSQFEQAPEFARLACHEDENEVKELMARIREIKRKSSGIVLPDGKVELRFPTRAMLDNVLARMKKTTDQTDQKIAGYWRVVVEAAVSDRL